MPAAEVPPWLLLLQVWHRELLATYANGRLQVWRRRLLAACILLSRSLADGPLLLMHATRQLLFQHHQRHQLHFLCYNDVAVLLDLLKTPARG